MLFLVQKMWTLFNWQFLVEWGWLNQQLLFLDIVLNPWLCLLVRLLHHHDPFLEKHRTGAASLLNSPD